MTTTATERRAIAYLANAVRPDWDQAGIESVLARLPPETSLADMAVAAIVAAATRHDQQTPAVIAMSGPHWPNPQPLRQAAWHDRDADVIPATREQIRAIRAQARSKS